MTVVITGGCGFLGQLLARRILSDRHLKLPDGTELARPRMVLADRPGAFRVASDLSGADLIMNEAVFVGTYPGLTRRMLDIEPGDGDFVAVVVWVSTLALGQSRRDWSTLLISLGETGLH